MLGFGIVEGRHAAKERKKDPELLKYQSLVRFDTSVVDVFLTRHSLSD